MGREGVKKKIKKRKGNQKKRRKREEKKTQGANQSHWRMTRESLKNGMSTVCHIEGRKDRCEINQHAGVGKITV